MASFIMPFLGQLAQRVHYPPAPVARSEKGALAAQLTQVAAFHLGRSTEEIAMTKPDVMWITNFQAVVFHKGRIWSLLKETDSEAWLIYTAGGIQNGVTVLGDPLIRFAMGGYHAALIWIQNWRPQAKAA